MPELQSRLSRKYDKDIIDAFKNISNHSVRLRELVRLGLEYEAHQRLGNQTVRPAKIEKPEPIVIKMRGVTKTSESVIINNLLAGFD